MTKFISLLLATAALAATSASAVTVTGATRIRVTSGLTNPDVIQIAELQAFDFNGVNVAQAANGGTASALSAYQDYLPGLAIDGDSTSGNPFFFHSDEPSIGNYFEVSFAAADLASLTIFGRKDCCQYRDVYNISIFNASGATLYSGSFDAQRVTSVSTTFDAAGAVPEPASWAMLIAGFGLTGAAARRRRRMVAVAA
jgi:hypothetical protein